MTAKTLLVAASALVAFGMTPALAGGDCPYGHASKTEIVVDAEQSTPAEAKTYTAIPYPLPTTDEDTLTASVETKADTTTE